MLDINEIFRDLATMVYDQGALVGKLNEASRKVRQRETNERAENTRRAKLGRHATRGIR